MLKEIDLNDPTVKALYDSYPEDRKDEFEEAYVYMKYFGPSIATMKSMMLPDVPLGERIKKSLKNASPELLEHMKKYAVKLATIDVDVDLEVPTTVIPFKMAREIVLEGNPTIAIGKCGCRATMPEAEVKCMPYPYEACLFIGDPAASFIAEHGDTFRKIDSKEAVRILEDFHKRGFVQQAYFKATLNGFYCICNCCSCCCPSIKKVNMALDGAIPFTNATGSGYVAEIGNECIGCGECVELCPYHAIELNEDENCAQIIFDRCMGCGVCEGQCPTGEITMRKEPSKGGILDIDELRKTAQT